MASIFGGNANNGNDVPRNCNANNAPSNTNTNIASRFIIGNKNIREVNKVQRSGFFPTRTVKDDRQMLLFDAHWEFSRISRKTDYKFRFLYG